MTQALHDAPVDPMIAAYVDSAAAALGLHLRMEYRAGVEHHFARLAAMARLVEQHVLDRRDEPAPVFHPGRP